MSAALFLAAFAAFLKTAAGTISYDDSGEMCVAALGDGILHPPGYPFLTLLMRLCAHLPVGSVAFRLNILAASGMAGSLCVLFHVWRGLFPRHAIAGWTGMLLAGLSLWPWSQAGVAKGAVYSINALLTISIVGTFWAVPFKPSRFAAIMGTAGIGLAHHWMSVLGVLPGLAWALGTQARSFRNLLLAGFGLVVGMSLYCALPIISAGDPFLNWGRPRTLAGFRMVLAREQYSRTLQETEPTAERIMHMGTALKGTAPLWPLVAFAAAGIAALMAGRIRATSSTVLFLGLLYGSLLFYGPMRSGAEWYFGIFSIPGALFVSLLALAGLVSAVTLLTGRPRSLLVMFLLGLLAAAEVPGRWRFNDRSREYLTHDLARNLQDMAAGPSLILANSDAVVFGNWHAWRVQETDSGLFAVPAPLLPQPWVAVSFGREVPGIKAPFPAPWAGAEAVPRLLEAWRDLNAGRFGIYSFKTPELGQSPAGKGMLPTALAYRLGDPKDPRPAPDEWASSVRRALRFRTRGLIDGEIERNARARATMQPLYFSGLLAWGNGLMDHSRKAAARILSIAAALERGAHDRALLALARGNIAVMSGDVEGGIARYLEAARENPGLGAAWLNIAYARLSQGREREALAALKTLIQATPEGPESQEAEAMMEQLERRAGSER